jgi:hypothetical protein
MAHTEMQIIDEITSKMPIAEIREHVNKLAVDAAEYARSLAPVYTGPERKGVTPGAYRDSIHAEEGESEFEWEPSAMVITRWHGANLLEFGTKHMHEFGTFAKTADHFGGTVEVTGKSHKRAAGNRLD